MNKTSGAIPGVIGNILVAVFAVLCLTVLAVLSLVTWRSDQRLSQATADSVAAYYEADRAAEETLAALRAGEAPAGVELSGNTASFTCPVDDTRCLRVEAVREAGEWRAVSWRVESTEEFIIDDSLPVWGG